MAAPQICKLEQLFHKFLLKEKFFLLSSIACFLILDYFEGRVSHEVLPILLILLSNILFHLYCMGDYWPSFQGPSCRKLGLRGVLGLTNPPLSNIVY